MMHIMSFIGKRGTRPKGLFETVDINMVVV